MLMHSTPQKGRRPPGRWLIRMLSLLLVIITVCIPIPARAEVVTDSNGMGGGLGDDMLSL